MEVCASKPGATLSTVPMCPMAPVTEKKNCISSRPSTPPAPVMVEKKEGKLVAAMTVMVVKRINGLTVVTCAML